MEEVEKKVGFERWIGQSKEGKREEFLVKVFRGCWEKKGFGEIRNCWIRGSMGW